jgi:hypothetical protein
LCRDIQITMIRLRSKGQLVQTGVEWPPHPAP